MRLVLATSPDPVVTLAEAKQYLRVIGGHDDALIQRLVNSGTQVMDGPTGILGRALGEQVWDAYWDGFSSWHFSGLRLPMYPLISVDEIAYRSAIGEDEVVLPANTFSVFNVGDTQADGYITSVAGWPSLATAHPDAVRIRFTAGYPIVGEAEAAASSVPEPIRQAILVDVKIQYDKPTGDDLKGLQDTYKRLISGFRRRRI